MQAKKTNVQITQELLALVNARYERTQKSGGSPADPEADPVIEALLDELSLAGDGTPASVDRSDPYFKSDANDPELFRQAVTRLRDQADEMPESLQQLFGKLLQ